MENHHIVVAVFVEVCYRESPCAIRRDSEGLDKGPVAVAEVRIGHTVGRVGTDDDVEVSIVVDVGSDRVGGGNLSRGRGYLPSEVAGAVTAKEVGNALNDSDHVEVSVFVEVAADNQVRMYGSDLSRRLEADVSSIGDRSRHDRDQEEEGCAFQACFHRSSLDQLWMRPLLAHIVTAGAVGITDSFGMGA